MAKITLHIEFQDEEITVDRLWYRAMNCGYPRVDPNQGWTELEKREAAKWFVQRVVERES